MKHLTTFLLSAVLTMGTSMTASAVEYKAIQPEKSKVTFQYKQMGVAMDGQFKKFATQLNFDPTKPAAAQAQIEIDLLAGVAANDPRLIQAQRRAEVIVARIAAERAKVGVNGGQKDFAALAADYERLAVDREFAEKAYVAALSAHDGAKAASQRTSRYLAAHVLPTRAEVSRYPERLSILGLMALFLGLAWSIGTLIVYSLKDRR